MNTSIKMLVTPDGQRRVEIFRRKDGSFGFAAETFSAHPRERCWYPWGHHSECYAPDAATAEAEARGRIPWLADASET